MAVVLADPTPHASSVPSTSTSTPDSRAPSRGVQQAGSPLCLAHHLPQLATDVIPGGGGIGVGVTDAVAEVVHVVGTRVTGRAQSLECVATAVEQLLFRLRILTRLHAVEQTVAIGAQPLLHLVRPLARRLLISLAASSRNHRPKQ